MAEIQTDNQTEAQPETQPETNEEVCKAVTEETECAEETADIEEPAAEETAEEELAVAEAAAENIPELMVEELSAEHNVSRLALITKLPKNIATYIVAAIYFVVGVLCVSITRYITVALPYIVGAIMMLVGVSGFIISLVRRDYKNIKTNKIATYILTALLGAMVILEEIDPQIDPIMLISIIWGVFGLFEGAHAFNHAITRITKSERCVYFLIKGIVECAVAFMMLYRPESHEAHFFHIVVFGISLIIDAVTMIPKIKQFLSKF